MFRDRVGLTQKQASEQLGITPYQLGNYETNRSEPNIATLKRMSQLYGVTIDKLVGNRSKPSVLPQVEGGETIDVEEIKTALEEMLSKINGQS